MRVRARVGLPKSRSAERRFWDGPRGGEERRGGVGRVARSRAGGGTGAGHPVGETLGQGGGLVLGDGLHRSGGESGAESCGGRW